MTTLIAPCGLDCAKCDAYIATQANDMAAIEAIVEKWRVEYNVPTLTISGVMCDSCLAKTDRHCSHCAECGIRDCAVQNGLTTCAECSDYASCEKLQGFFQMVPQAHQNLDGLRATP